MQIDTVRIIFQERELLAILQEGLMTLEGLFTLMTILPTLVARHLLPPLYNY